MTITLTINADTGSELLDQLAALTGGQSINVAPPTKQENNGAPAADNDAEVKQEEVDPPKKPRRSRTKKTTTVDAEPAAKKEPESAEPTEDDASEDSDPGDITLEMLRQRTVKIAAFVGAMPENKDNAGARREAVNALLKPFDAAGVGKLETKQYVPYSKALDAKAQELGMDW